MRDAVGLRFPAATAKDPQYLAPGLPGAPLPKLNLLAPIPSHQRAGLTLSRSRGYYRPVLTAKTA